MEFFKNKNSVINIVKGTTISFGTTVVLLTIFSALLVYTNLSEETIKPVIIVVTGISILLGSSICTRKIRKNGVINGAIIGCIYMCIIYFISSALNNNFSLNITTIIMMISGIAGGILGGIIGVNT